MRLLSYNIRYGGVGREKALAAVINACEPDLVILQEATRPEVVRTLASACGMKVWGGQPGHSLAFLSRVEVSHHEWHRVILGRRRYLELVLAQNSLRIVGVHLAAIHSNLTELRRWYELRAMLARLAQYHDTLHLVTGDFNTLAPGEELDVSRLPFRLRAFVRVSGGRIRWRTIQLMLQAGYVDAYRWLHPDDLGDTFPTWDPHLRLDYLFAPQPFAAVLKACDVVRSGPLREASDHFPLLSIVAP